MLDLSPFLCIGVITEIFKHSEILDVTIIKLKTCDYGLVNECIFNLSSFTETPSNPGEESSFKASIAFIIS